MAELYQCPLCQRIVYLIDYVNAEKNKRCLGVIFKNGQFVRCDGFYSNYVRNGVV